MTTNFTRYAAAVASAAVLGLGTLAAPAAQAQVYLDVRLGAPPPPRYEAPPPPRNGYVWAPGYWEPRGHRYAWRAGHWQRGRPGQHWRAPEYREHGGRWQQVRGGWDRDHGGPPDHRDHRDRHPGPPGRR